MSQNPRTNGLSHIAIRVRDLSRTRKFYEDVFDMQVMYDESDFLQLTTPGANDILVFEKHDHVESRNTGGIIHFGFRLRKPESIDVILRKLDEAGAEIIDTGNLCLVRRMCFSGIRMGMRLRCGMKVEG